MHAEGHYIPHMWYVTADADFHANVYMRFFYFLVENIIKETLNYNIINYMDPHAPEY
jgi:hypothetical protein